MPGKLLVAHDAVTALLSFSHMWCGAATFGPGFWQDYTGRVLVGLVVVFMHLGRFNAQ